MAETACIIWRGLVKDAPNSCVMYKSFLTLCGTSLPRGSQFGIDSEQLLSKKPF